MHRGKFRIACIPPSYFGRTSVQIFTPGASPRPLVRYLVCSTTFPTLICISQRTLAHVVWPITLLFVAIFTLSECTRQTFVMWLAPDSSLRSSGLLSLLLLSLAPNPFKTFALFPGTSFCLLSSDTCSSFGFLPLLSKLTNSGTQLAP